MNYTVKGWDSLFGILFISNNNIFKGVRMIKKSTAIIFAIITALIGVFIGLNIQNNCNTNSILAIIVVFNAVLIISTIKSTSNNDYIKK